MPNECCGSHDSSLDGGGLCRRRPWEKLRFPQRISVYSTHDPEKSVQPAASRNPWICLARSGGLASVRRSRRRIHWKFILLTASLFLCAGTSACKRCKIYNEECFRGYIASQRNCFYGLKVHALMIGSGIPAEIVLSHGSSKRKRHFCWQCI